MSRTRIPWLAILAALLACGAPPGPAETRLFEGAVWFDDWYAVAPLDARTWAILEARYPQHNVNYLIAGDERAILFDSGPGERDIRPVLESLTRLPITAAFSHTHYDHIGNHARFASVAALDHPSLRARMQDGRFTPSLAQHGALGRPSFPITEWWTVDSHVDLGGRRLQVLHVPGHTPESVALFDPERRWLFSGDFLYLGDLFAFNPGADLAVYRRSMDRLADELPDDVAVFGAHVPRDHPHPRQDMTHVVAAAEALAALVEGRAPAPEWSRFLVLPLRRTVFSERLAILTGPFD